jgi:site-specific DNA-methyltransferase (adenine-specific)
MTEAILKNIPIAAINFGERYRQDFPEIESLKADIQKNQLIHPIAVLDNKDGTFLLLAGGRRLQACTDLQYTRIAAHVYEPPLNELEIRSIELAENIHRENLTFSEKANLTMRVHDLYVEMYGKAMGPAEGQSYSDTAKLLSMSRSHISQDIELARAIEAMPSLAQAKNKTEAIKLWNRAKEKVLSKELSDRYEKRKAETSLDKQLKDIANSYCLGNFFESVKNIPDRSIHVCEVDPPYGIDLKHNKDVDTKGTSLDDYNEVPKEEYPGFIEKVISECDRILLPNGWILLWFDPNRWGDLIYNLLIAKGFELRKLSAIWVKENFRGQTHWPEFVLASDYECFYYARKGLATIQKQGRSNLFRYPPVPAGNKIHPTERPVELMQDVLSTFCPQSSRLIVPFAGSGNTILAAANLGINAVGYDLSETYKNSYVVKVYQQKPGQYTSL